MIEDKYIKLLNRAGLLVWFIDTEFQCLFLHSKWFAILDVISDVLLIRPQMILETLC